MKRSEIDAAIDAADALSKRHGFRHRMSDRAGRAVIKARRLKGRKRLSA